MGSREHEEAHHGVKIGDGCFVPKERQGLHWSRHVHLVAMVRGLHQSRRGQWVRRGEGLGRHDVAKVRDHQ